MLLDKKIAIIYGGGGSIGGAVARAFAREGATVFLAGRTRAKLDAVAKQIRADGGSAEVGRVDALKEKMVNRFVDDVVAHAGRLDISMNVIGLGDVQKPLTEISINEFLAPISIAMRTQFFTTRAASRQMMKQKSGVILTFGGGGTQTMPGLGGFKIALDAMEGLRRQWAVELGKYGIRVVTLKTGGIPETIPASEPMRASVEKSIVKETLLKRAATLEDVGNVAAFVASDKARTLTSTEVNISAGAIAD